MFALALCSLATPSAAHALLLEDASSLPPPAAAPRVSLTCTDRPDVHADDAEAGTGDAAEAKPARADTRSLDDSSLPWCTNADDPRCSPMEGGSLPPQVDAQPKLAWSAPQALPEPRVVISAALRPHEILGAPRAGEHTRLDRPPR
ncbi:MAG TPA: hypothetical protein VHM19_23525 [Polyangiales bacterium]|nr:hypothetical protein [Polyangiales bacterium]